MVTRVMGFACACCCDLGNNTCMALGTTMVDVIMKKISNRNITSVIDAMLKFDSMLNRCFKAIIF